MAEILIRRPHLSDICRLVKNLRQADRDEMHAVGFYNPREVIEHSLHTSADSLAVLAGGDLVMLIGVSPHETEADVGVPWALGTDLVHPHRRTLMRLAPTYIETMLRGFPRLVNFVHAENTLAISWLRHMRFELAPAAPYGPHRALFHRFEKRANV